MKIKLGIDIAFSNKTIILFLQFAHPCRHALNAHTLINLRMNGYG